MINSYCIPIKICCMHEPIFGFSLGFQHVSKKTPFFFFLLKSGTCKFFPQSPLSQQILKALAYRVLLQVLGCVVPAGDIGGEI